MQLLKVTNVPLSSSIENYFCKDSQSPSTEPTDGMRRKNVVMVVVGVTASCGGYIFRYTSQMRPIFP